MGRVKSRLSLWDVFGIHLLIAAFLYRVKSQSWPGVFMKAFFPTTFQRWLIFANQRKRKRWNVGELRVFPHLVKGYTIIYQLWISKEIKWLCVWQNLLGCTATPPHASCVHHMRNKAKLKVGFYLSLLFQGVFWYNWIHDLCFVGGAKLRALLKGILHWPHSTHPRYSYKSLSLS